MRIAINAMAMRPELYGVGNYIKHLVCGLAEIDSHNEYVIFVSEAAQHHFSGVGANMRFRHAPRNPAIRMLWEQSVLPWVLASSRIDVYHGPMFVAPLWKNSAQVVSVLDMTFHLTPERHKLHKVCYFRFMIPQMARRADRIIAISESTRKDFLRLTRTSAEKIETIHLGVEPGYRRISDPAELERVRSKYRLPQAFLLYLGLIEPRKNIDVLVEAYSQSPALQAGHDLVIAGNFGWDYKSTLRQIETSPARLKIHLPGYVDSADMPALYSLADVFVYPSRYEGFGLPVLEAMACGTPVVTSNASSMPEIVGADGLLVAPSDAPALRQALENIVADRHLHQSLAERGSRRAGSFSWQQVARKTLAVYEQAFALAHPLASGSSSPRIIGRETAR